MSDVEIVRTATQFELLKDGRRIGQLRYTRDGDVLTLTHTEVSAEFSGQGLAGRLVESALTDIRDHGQSGVAQCPYARSYLHKHPQWADLTV